MSEVEKNMTMNTAILCPAAHTSDITNKQGWIVWQQYQRYQKALAGLTFTCEQRNLCICQ